MVSIASDGNQSDGYNYEPSISADGRFVAFSSYAGNLVAGDSNLCSDIFVRDRLLNTTERVSISINGEEANSASFQPFISSDGRYVTFTSYASNLVLDDTNGYADIFLRDCLLNITQRISLSSNAEEGNGESYESSISADGRFVAFSSYASNLVVDDTNGCQDVFVYDRLNNITQRISLALDGEANFGSYDPIISADGNFIAFTSDASNLVETDNNWNPDIFIHDELKNH